MGHLISARALRLGWTLTWADTWFAKLKSDYSFYLFLCYRIRHFILAYFYSKKRDSNSWIVSHIELIRRYYDIRVRIYFYDAAFEENRALFFPKLIKSIKKNFDGFFFENKNDINKSNLITTLKLFNHKYKYLWLRDFLVLKKCNKFFINNSLLRPLDFLKVREFSNFFKKIYDSIILFWLFSYNQKSGFYYKKRYLLKSDFNKYVEDLCNVNFMRSNLFKRILISRLQSSIKKRKKIEYLPVAGNKLKNSNLVDRWMNLFNIIPYQQFLLKFRRKLRYVEFQHTVKYKNIGGFFLYSFHSYMSRYYMSYDLNKLVWKNWRFWSGFDKSNLMFNIMKEKSTKINFDDFFSQCLKKKPWFHNISNSNIKLESIKKKKFNQASSIKKAKFFNNVVVQKVNRRKFFENKQSLSIIFKAVFTLVFISFFSTFRFNTAFDWKYWFYFLKQLQKRDYNNLYKYFKYRSIFTGISYKINMVYFSFILAFLIRFGGNLSLKKKNFIISEFFQNLYLMTIIHLYITVVWVCLFYRMKFFINQFVLTPEYYLISNESINAVFLSRYIAKMLDYIIL